MGVYNIEGQLIDGASIYVDVKTFGAKGDGVTDDRPAIQDALAYCLTYDRTLYFSEGTYLLKTDDTHDHGFNISQSVKIIGAGAGKAILKADSSFLGAMHVFNIVDASNVWISDFTIDGGVTPQTRPSATGGHAIRIGNSQNITIKNMELCNTGHYGIGQQAGSSQNILINNVHIHDTGGDGIDFKNFSDTNADLVIDTANIHDIGLSQENQVAIDVRCNGANISNIYIELPDANNASGIRARTSNATQGTGGKHINISNVIIKGNSGNVGEGVSMNEEGVKLVNAFIEKVGIGVRLYNYAPEGETQPTESYGHVTNCNIIDCNVNAIRADTNGNAVINCDIGNMGSGLTAVYLAGGDMHTFEGCVFHDCDILMNIANTVSKVSLMGCEGKTITTKFSGKTSAVEKIACHGLD